MTPPRPSRSALLVVPTALRIGPRGARGQGTPVGPAGPEIAAAGPEIAAAETVPANASFGVQIGFPAHRTANLGAAVPAISIEGSRATMGIAYDGAVVEILTGREIAATGEAEGDFRRDGCRWVRTALRA